MLREQATGTYCQHDWSFCSYWAHTQLEKCSFKFTNYCIDQPKQHPWLYIKFSEESCYSICPGSRYWACLWLILLQGRSLCDASIHRCAEIHNTMLELPGNANKTSEQHCELGVARIARHVKDLPIIHSWFTKNYQFPEKADLMFIFAGLTTLQDSDTNCDKANEIGAKIYPLIIKHTHLQKSPKRRRLLL